MKKVIFLTLICICLSGCGNTKKCSLTTNDDLMTVKTIYKIKYDRNIVSEIISTTDYKIFDDNLKTNFGSLINNIKADLESYNIKYDYINKKDNYSITAYYNIGLMSEESVNELFGSNHLNDVIDKFEKEGFKCK